MCLINICCIEQSPKKDAIIIFHTGVQDFSIIPIVIANEGLDTTFIVQQLNQKNPPHRIYQSFILNNNDYQKVNEIFKNGQHSQEDKTQGHAFGSFTITSFSTNSVAYSFREYYSDSSIKYFQQVNENIVGAIGSCDLTTYLSKLMNDMSSYIKMRKDPDNTKPIK